MKMQKINLDFSNLIGALLLQKSETIITRISTSKVFPPPFANIVSLQASYDQYQTDYTKAESLDTTEVKRKSDSRKLLETELVKMGLSVMALANGSVPMLTESGFPLTKVSQPRYIQPAGELMIVNGITSGQIIAKGKRDKAATGYQFLLSTVPPADGAQWTIYNTSRSKYTIDGLKRGQEVWLKFAVIGARNQVSYSSVVSFIVQ